jgi:hypothetical protein
MPASRPALLLACIVGVALAACGGSTDGPTGFQPLPGSKAELVVAPIELPAGGYIEALGHLAPTPHTIPTDHIYFITVNPDVFPIVRDSVRRTVRAAASGVVTYILSPSGADNKVGVLVTNDFTYYIDHMLPRADLHVGSIVHAGDSIGTTNPGGGIDLGAYDLSTPRLSGLVNTTRYPEPQLHTVSPIRYYAEPLRSQLYARVKRNAADKDGKTDFDIKGRLIGNWYDQSVNGIESQTSTGWPKSLAFVYDNFDPAVPRISIGGTISSPFLGTTAPGAPRFEDVGITSGVVSYSIRYTRETNIQFGLMLVQMLAEDRIRVEVFESQTLSAASFDGNARIYVR